jgi:cysteate synthase
MNFAEKTNYKLRSLISGEVFEDTGWILDPPGNGRPGFVRAEYEQEQLLLRGDDHGLYTFANWLPVLRELKGSSPPVTYRSEGLSAVLGLSNLYITFSGYWPEKGALMDTCSFKETEAYSVCARLDPSQDKILVVASAGNTARSFARVCSDNGIPLLLCVPEDNIDALWFDRPIREHVKLIVSGSGSDYFDAIHLSNLACGIDGFIPEGGARNVARRDGMGTTVLSAVTTIGEIPEYYFQAIGSGTGAIAAWEANLRLIADGRFGNRKMKLMVSQNKPFTPIYDAWKAGSRDMLPLDEDHARKQVQQIMAKVLSNRKPPYSLTGGLFDAMKDAGGDVLLASNEEAMGAARLFEETEGIDIHPAAAIATASLVNAVREGLVGKDSLIMLNITGGGEERFINTHKLYHLKPSLVFDANPEPGYLKTRLEQLFGLR